MIIALASSPRPLNLPHVFAHRGGWGPLLQNTVANLDAAAKLGAGIEYDIRRTLDGVLVVHHDPKVGDAEIATTNFADIPRLEDGTVIPTFAQALAVGVKYGVGQMIETKEDGYDAQMIDTVAASGAKPGTLFFQSFHPDSVHELHELRPDIPSGLLIEPTRDDPTGRRALNQAAQIGADYILPKYSLTSMAFLASAQSMHLPVVAWAPWEKSDAEIGAKMIHNPLIASVIVNELAPALAAAKDTDGVAA